MNSTSPADWHYTAEGGANLVLSYTGSHPTLSNKLLRLRKRKLNPTPTTTTTTNPDLNPDFSTHVIAPLLGEQFVVKMRKVEAKKEFLEALRDDLKEQGVRPGERAEVDEIDMEDQSVMLAEDLVNGSGVLAFEIKPKWGFLPSSEYLSPESLPIKSKYCRFCMHSYLKSMKKSGSTTIGGYCPLDLYSGEPERMARALRSLWEGWIESNGDGNNFRVFLEGKRLSPNDPSDFQLLSHHLKVDPSSETLFQSIKYLLLPFLLHSPILKTLKHLQSFLDPLDIEGLSATLLQRGTTLSEAAEGEQPTLKEWKSWLLRWSEVANSKVGAEGSKRAKEEVDTKDLVLAYLLSASFKDCSILLRFEKCENGESWEGLVKAIDLDPKPIDRLKKYWELDQEIVKTFKEALERGVLVKGPCIV